jgi:hypothetical protein
MKIGICRTTERNLPRYYRYDMLGDCDFVLKTRSEIRL